MQNNVVQFTGSRYRPLILQDVKEAVEDIHEVHVHHTIQTISPILFNYLSIAGFDIDGDDDESLKDGVFIVEAIRSVLLKRYDIHHSFQDIAETVLQLDQDGMVNVANSINLEFKKTDTI